MKKLSLPFLRYLKPVILFGLLLLPLGSVLVFGYPLWGDISVKRIAPGLSNRCFKIGDTGELLSCYAAPKPRIKMGYLLIYFAEFKEMFLISGLLLVAMIYSTTWLIQADDQTETGLKLPKTVKKRVFKRSKLP